MDQISIYTAVIMDWIGQYGPKLVGALLVFIVGLYVINLIGKLLSKGLIRRGADASLQSFLASLVGGGLRILLLITVAGMLGIETTSFVAIVGAMGLAVGLALQGSLGNFAGGVLILVFKPFKVGDLVESGGQTGHVQEIQIFNTILLTADNKTVILANGAVSNGTIINYSKHGNLRVDIVMAFGDENDIEKARTAAMEAMAANQFVLKVPAASVNVLKVADGMVTFAIRPYATPENYWDAFFSVQEDVKKAFDKYGIVGPTPTHIVINK